MPPIHYCCAGMWKGGARRSSPWTKLRGHGAVLPRAVCPAAPAAGPASSSGADRGEARTPLTSWTVGSSVEGGFVVEAVRTYAERGQTTYLLRHGASGTR